MTLTSGSRSRSALSRPCPSRRGITRSVTTIAGRNAVTFSQGLLAVLWRCRPGSPTSGPARSARCGSRGRLRRPARVRPTARRRRAARGCGRCRSRGFLAASGFRRRRFRRGRVTPFCHGPRDTVERWPGFASSRRSRSWRVRVCPPSWPSPPRCRWRASAPTTPAATWTAPYVFAVSLLDAAAIVGLAAWFLRSHGERFSDGDARPAAGPDRSCRTACCTSRSCS